MRLTLEAMPRYGRPKRWEGFFQRNKGRTIIAAFEGRGINFHRKGGVRFTGLPSTGGTTICWGRLRERCDGMDAEYYAKTDILVSSHTWVRCFGPIMIRVGRDF